MARGLLRLIACLLPLAAGCGPSEQKQIRPQVQSELPRNTVSVPSEPRKEDSFDFTLVPGRIHEVRRHDTLEGLAERYYGNKKHWRKIWVANRNRLDNPHMLPVGMKLIIP
ncbi:MAG: LysM peptidoglycan-binding domain-containing protein [Phycisphaerae bacterium]